MSRRRPGHRPRAGRPPGRRGRGPGGHPARPAGGLRRHADRGASGLPACRDAQRGGQSLAREAHTLLADLPERAAGHGDPQQALELRELLDAVAALPAGQRDALLATALTTQDQRALASTLGTTPAGARQLVRRTRQRLRDGLGSWVPWLATRASDLAASLTPASGVRGGAIAVALVATIAAPAPAPAPRPPAPPSVAGPTAPQPPPAVQVPPVPVP